MSYEEFLDYIKDNLADCYKGIMVSEEVDKVKTDALSDDEEVDKLYFNSRREIEKKYEGCEVFLRKVVKNNGIVLDAVSIYLEGEHVSPNIYVRLFYEKYLLGKPLDFILSEIVFQYRLQRRI